jgi:thymidylate synthase ThyX
MNKEELFEFMSLKHGELPETVFVDQQDEIKVTMIDYPDPERVQSLVVNMAGSSWVPFSTEGLSIEQIHKEFDDTMTGNGLGQAMEALQFTFVIEGLTLHGTHALVRNRIGIAYMQQSHAVRDFRHDKILVPRSYGKYPQLLEKYKEWCTMGKQLYADLLDTQEISINDARLSLPKTIPSHIYFSCNFMTLQSIYAKRSDTQEEAVEMNIMAQGIKDAVISKFPYLEKYLVKSCDKGTCLHNRKGFKANCIYARDDLHKIAGYEDEFTLHKKTKAELSEGPHIRAEAWLGEQPDE